MQVPRVLSLPTAMTLPTPAPTSDILAPSPIVDGGLGSVPATTQGQGQPSAIAGQPMCDFHPRNIYVAGLPATCTDDQLKDIFTPFGTVLSAKLMRSTAKSRQNHTDAFYTGGSEAMKQVGFVLFSMPEEATKAIGALAERELEGEPLIVRRARISAPPGKQRRRINTSYQTHEGALANDAPNQIVPMDLAQAEDQQLRSHQQRHPHQHQHQHQPQPQHLPASTGVPYTTVQGPMQPQHAPLPPPHYGQQQPQPVVVYQLLPSQGPPVQHAGAHHALPPPPPPRSAPPPMAMPFPVAAMYPMGTGEGLTHQQAHPQAQPPLHAPVHPHQAPAAARNSASVPVHYSSSPYAAPAAYPRVQ